MPHFSARTQGPGAPLAPSYEGQAITPSDAVDLPIYNGNPTVGLYVTGAGNIAFQTRGGIAGSFTAVPAGTFLDVAVSRVLATGTTATGICQLTAPQYS